MQTWKTKRQTKKTRSARAPWKARVATVCFLLLTVVVGFYDFPQAWNKSADWFQSVSTLSLPRMNEQAYRLGLDLQGGTHLVYEADMENIPEPDRLDALSGVRDVIERRVNAFGVSEPIVQTTSSGGAYRVIVELAGVLDVTEAIAQIGETPVLEFKEENLETERQPTAEDQATLKDLQTKDRAAVAEALKRAQTGEDFDALVDEYSVASDKDTHGVQVITKDTPAYVEIATSIAQNRPRAGSVYWKTVETDSTYEIVKVLEYTTTPNMHLSHILICYKGAPGCSSTISALEANIQLSDLKKQATTENFAELAKQYSTDPSAEQNSGDLGWATGDAYVPSFAAAAVALPVGEISEPVQTDYGYHLIYKQEQTDLPAYKIQHISIHKSTMNDVVPPVSAWKNTELSGKQLQSARVEFDQQTGRPHVAIVFNSEGGDLFGQLTEANIGKKIAIFLDGTSISEPTVQGAIYGGSAIITGDFTLTEAKILAQRLNAGALPVPVSLLSQQTVGPTLGIASLHKSVVAALAGFALVALYMLVLYRLPGFVSVVALLLFAVLNMLAYRLFGVTITLAGIAGFVLSLGIAVDANVLTIERLREELAFGRDALSASEEAGKRAWAAIRDGHFTTLISSIVLYWFSSSFIRGFALTLGIGVILSLFTAVYVSRQYLHALFVWKWSHHPRWFGVKRKEESR